MLLRSSLCLALLVCFAANADAQAIDVQDEGEGETEQGEAETVQGEPEISEDYRPELNADYFTSDLSLPFVYGSAAVALSLQIFAEPREPPLFFSEDEGGAEIKDELVPTAALSIYALAGAGIVALVPNNASLPHLKGYSQAVLTTMAATQIVKNGVGRHRPNYVQGETDPDQRRSFFSGHSSITAASSVYMGLYFYHHLSPQLRGPMAGVYRAAVYLLLTGVAVGVPYSRIADNRHYLGDVLTGSFVGSAMAVGFFAYQESRYQDKRGRYQKEKRGRLVVLPNLESRGISLQASW